MVSVKAAVLPIKNFHYKLCMQSAISTKKKRKVLFIHFQQGYDRIRKPQLYAAIGEIGIERKLVNLVKMTLAKTENRVRIRRNVSASLKVKKGKNDFNWISSSLQQTYVMWPCHVFISMA